MGRTGMVMIDIMVLEATMIITEITLPMALCIIRTAEATTVAPLATAMVEAATADGDG